MIFRPGTDQPVDVVVLASGVNTIPLYEGFVPGYKSLIPYRGRASVQYVLDALCAVEGIGRICVEGPVELLKSELADRLASGRVTLTEGGETFLDSLAVGLKQFRSSDAVLFVTGDAPLITPEAIRDFLQGSAAAKAAGEGAKYAQNVYVAVAPRTSFTGDYLQFTKPFNRFRDVTVCHGNLFLLDPDLLDNADVRRRVNRMYAGRKSLLSLLAFGWKVALAYVVGVEVLHAVTLRRMAEIASRPLRIGIVPVVIDHPGMTMDVDEADDYRFVRDQIDKAPERFAPCN